MAAINKNVSDKPDLPVIPFVSQQVWEQWLEQNHAISKGIWLQMFKKSSGIASVNYAEALDVALCYGWIDGQLKSIDELSYMQRFTPRRPRSIWSKRNIEHIARLTNEGRMKPAGIKEAEAAKSDGRWEVAYDGQGTMSLPSDFQEVLLKNEKALAFYESLNKANKYAIAWRIQTAKRSETREKRIKEILEMLGREEKFHM
ncbi:MAG: YdeI/OmpD-associated family protein [Bacteroidales bacterium]|nr:YdeI/OmpD-associated family protein [Bacteroidales bacterium]